jgi:hypothetical protein
LWKSLKWKLTTSASKEEWPHPNSQFPSVISTVCRDERRKFRVADGGREKIFACGKPVEHCGARARIAIRFLLPIFARLGRIPRRVPLNIFAQRDFAIYASRVCQDGT